MKIAQIAPLVESVPPRLYGGTERIVSYLTEELVALGHDVTLFASGDSITAATLASCVPTSVPNREVRMAIFCCDTRYLSRLEMLLNGKRLLLLGSNVRDDNAILTVDLTNPDIYLDRQLVLPKDMLHIVRTFFLWRGMAYQRLRIQNHRDCPFDVRLSFAFASDLPGTDSRCCPSSTTRFSNVRAE